MHYKIQSIMNSESFFKEITHGLIDHSIDFSIWSYVYTKKNGFSMPSIEESDATGYCSIEYYEEEQSILVCIDNMEFYWNEFPSRFSSKIDAKQCKIDGEINEEIRTVIIPFDDMAESTNDNYRIELMFKNKKLICITFWITKMEERFIGSTTQLCLIGELNEE